MADYDFRTLNDKEFEVFCADLLSDVEGTRFERFKPGRDSGVDGRYFCPEGGEVVLQCKHWAGTPTDHLVRTLRDKEKTKLDRLKPARYILAVSNALSRADKLAISKALAPYIKSHSDIFGKEDLNDLLKPRPDVERRHYKLWLCSASVISHIINKPIFERSAFSLEETIQSARKYVRTANHAKAIDMLERLRAVIITGEPGVGKTTLAEHVCLHYVAKEFEFLKIAEEIEEAEAVFESDRKQIFYFDDFLGRNYLEAVGGHEGSRIVQFLRRVNKARDKRLILTSRSTILNQGKILIDSFRHQNIDRNEFELRVTSLTDMDKAQILYNHIWHSSLKPEFIEALYEKKRYRTIIAHDNYNPRLINFITDSDRVENLDAEAYWPYIEATLDNPTEVWDNPFIAQQDDFGRAIVLLLALNGTDMEQGELAEAYLRFIARPENAGMKGHRDYLTNIRHLSGSLINRKIRESEAALDSWLKLFNPSLRDYALRRYVADVPTLTLGFMSLRTRSSAMTLQNLVSNQILAQDISRHIGQAILREAGSLDFVGYGADYISTIARMLLEDENLDEKHAVRMLQPSLDFMAGERLPNYHETTVKVIHWAVERRVVGIDVAHRLIVEACDLGSSAEEELEALSNLLGLLDPADKSTGEATEKFNRLVVDYLSETIAEDIDGGDTFANVDYGDYEGARENVEAVIIQRLENFGMSATQLEIQEILGHYDCESALDRFYEYVDDDRGGGGGRYMAPSDEIDDLFDRG